MRVTVCETCRLASPGAPSDGRGLRAALEAALQARGLSDRVEVASASCLDVCGEGVTVAVDTAQGRALFSHTGDTEALLARLVAEAG